MFLAQSAHGFENTLVKELASFGIKGKFLKERGKKKQPSHIFLQDYMKYNSERTKRKCGGSFLHGNWRSLGQFSRTIDRLKLQLGQDFVARGDKEFIGGLKKLPW
jgi:23S rRNA G2445 N2-methylase RlmL